MDLVLSTRQVDDLAIVSVGGEVDLETASQLGDHALDALRDVSPHVLLDLTDVTFMDSTGLKVFSFLLNHVPSTLATRRAVDRLAPTVTGCW